MSIKSSSKLMTEAWSNDVGTLERAIAGFKADRNNDCQVSFFEIASDGKLHVNVTHRFRTETAPGWAGPAAVAGGFVHNRTFHERRLAHIVKMVRGMALAARV
jgi:hypothetical protein